MRRRTFTIGAGLALSTGAAGCASQSSTESPSGSNHSADNNQSSTQLVSTEFGITEPRLSFDDPPKIDKTDGEITAAGTVRHGGSVGGTVALVYAGYEISQKRLDLLVAAVDEENFQGGHNDFEDAGYRVTASVDQPTSRQPSVTVTEHHCAYGARSATIDFHES